MVVPTALQNTPVCAWSHRLLSVTPGPGMTYFFQPDRWISSQMIHTMARAASFGHTALQAFLAVCRLSRGAGATVSSASSPISVLLAMAAYLFPQPVGDRAGQLGDRRGVDPPRPLDGDLVLGDDPARPAAQQHHPVAEAHRLADVVRHEQHGQG